MFRLLAFLASVFELHRISGKEHVPAMDMSILPSSTFGHTLTKVPR